MEATPDFWGNTSDYLAKQDNTVGRGGKRMSEKVDVLNREGFINRLIRIIEQVTNKGQGCCFGIDGEWGSGKTFVLEKFEEKLKEIQSEETADNKYYVFHYDCWKYDYYEEPIIAIISAMIDEIENEPRFFSEEIQNVGKLAGKTVKDVLKAIMRELAQNKIGIDLVELATGILKDYDEEKEQNKDFDSLYGFRKALDTTRRGILEIANNKAVIIVVDELDRCLPTYAIKILERLHHIFHELDNVVVMVSMDKRQLEQSIKALYGDIDVDVYLRKFISFKVHLDNGIADNFISKYESYVSLFRNTEEERINFFFKSIMQGIDMRTQERIFRKAEIIHYMISAEEKMDSSIMTFEILFLTVALKCKSTELQWLIDEKRNANIENLLTKEYYTRLKIYEDGLKGNGTMSDGKERRICIGNDLIAKTFFWIANVFYPYEKNVCGPYYYAEPAEKEITLVRKFADLIDVIDVD